MENYIKRYSEYNLQRKLKSSAAVLVTGPKFSGKTTTSLQFSKSVIRLNTSKNIEIAKLDPSSVLFGEKPRLIDEWQTVPDIWNEVRGFADENQGFGQFILTGSTTPADKTKIFHSGAGRISKVIMRPMSLSESGDSKCSILISELFNNPDLKFFDENKSHTLKKIAYYICRGGWPLSVLAGEQIALDVTKNYYEGLFNFEYNENEKFRNKNPEILRMVLKSYARNISTPAPIQTIRSDLISSNNRTIDTKTIDDYIDALKDLFIIEDIESWNPNLRSKTIVRSSNIRHFFDTSIAACCLKITPEDLMNDLNTFGLFFEDMVIRDLKIYSSVSNGKILHYRDSNGLECDAIICLKDGRFALAEIKLGGEKQIEDAAKNLNKLISIVENKISFGMIITAVGPAYRRNDGIFVVPINLLGEKMKEF